MLRIKNHSCRRRRRAAGKFRLGYISQDFCHHVIGYYIVEMLESHDKERFELYGFSLTA